MKTFLCEVEMLEDRVAPAALFTPVNPALTVSPVMEFAESTTVIPALTPNLAPISESPISDLLLPTAGVLPLGQFGSVIPPINTPGTLLSGMTQATNTQMFGTF